MSERCESVLSVVSKFYMDSAVVVTSVPVHSLAALPSVLEDSQR